MGEFQIPPEYRLPLLCIGASLVLCTAAVFLLVKTLYYTEPIRFSSDTNETLEASAQGELLIDVSGAIAKPGVYHMFIGSRIDDAITMAGGLTENADLEYIAQFINKAAVLSDGAKLYIPIIGEAEQEQSQSLVAVSNQTVSVNTASIEALDTLSGVGPVTAKKIIDNRPYATLDNLVTKKVMSKSLLDKLRNALSL